VHREFLELFGQQPIVPGRDLGQPVIGNPEGSSLLRSEVIEAQRRHLGYAEQAACEKPTVPDDNIVLAIGQNWDIEIKGRDAVGNLPDLLLSMAPRVGGIGFQRVDPTVNDL
jgi:hypothetical protein